MQIYTSLPTSSDLPAEIADDVLTHINQPFNDIEQAQQYWQAYTCSLVLIEAEDIPQAVRSMPDATRQHVLYVLEYPEYIDAIGEYELSLGITNDEGGGIYLLCHSCIDQERLKEALINAEHID